MTRKKRLRLLIPIAVVLLLPLWMWLAWLFSPNRPLVVAIIDKTALDQKGQEHISLTWVLNNCRLTKTSAKRYRIRDYFGFFPLGNEKFKIKGLERFSPEQLKQLSDDADLAYFTDTYGIAKKEWYSQKSTTARSGIIYGGMSQNDIAFLQDMKEKHKLIITEFNSIGSPTEPVNRDKFEKLFGMHWTGWTARYFDSFDTLINKELPRWLIDDYKNQHDYHWPFHKGGVAFVSNTDQVVVLEDSTHLTDPVPHIVTYGYGKKNLALPARIKYSFWFDVIKPDLNINHAVSRFELALNAKGAEELKKNGIPATFPAIIMHRAKDYQFYYFSGDFCDNPISMKTSYFKGIGLFKWLFYNADNRIERSSFFWAFYRPMMARILEEAAAEKRRN